MSQESKSTEFKAALSAAGFTGDLIIPGDSEYLPSLIRWARNAQKNAALVAFVKSAQDVSRVIELVNAYSARGNPVHMTIRGGGHDTTGASSSDGGIVVDLSRYLKTVRVDKEKKLAYVGGGATWADVDTKAITFGLATTGGNVNHAGVGGLSLGGGYGWIMGTAGMVVDNIVEATIVTAEGTILTINSSSHPDLYWAIRGGGPNFCCVVEFVYQLHTQLSHVFVGPLVFPPPLLPDVVATVQDWHATADEKAAAVLAMTTKGPTGVPVLVVTIFYNGDEAEGRREFTKLIALGPVVDAAAMVPYEKLNALQNHNLLYGDNYHLRATMRGGKPMEPGAAQEIFNKMVEISGTPGVCATISNPTIVILWEFFHSKKAMSVPADATAFRMREPHVLVPIMIKWEGDSAEAAKDAEERVVRLKEAVEERLKGTFVDSISGNNPGNGKYVAPLTVLAATQGIDAAAALYGGNYPRLQDVKRRYDPNGLFGSWFPIQTS